MCGNWEKIFNVFGAEGRLFLTQFFFDWTLLYGHTGLEQTQTEAVLEFFRECLGNEDEDIMCQAIEGVSKCLIWDRLQDEEVCLDLRSFFSP